MKRCNLALLITLLLLFSALVFFNLPKNENKIITFAFDDGLLNTYENAFPLFKEQRYVGTVYVITGNIGETFEGIALMNVEHLKELSSNGWEIGSHTVNHYDLTSLHVGFIDYELNQSKESLESLGFEVKSLAIPYGRYNDVVRNVAEDYYTSVRPSSWGVNNLNQFDKYEIKSIWLTNSTTFEFVKNQIDSMNEDEWLFFMIHNVDYEDLGVYNISPLLLEEIITYIKNKNIEVKTISEVVNEYGRI